MTNLPIASTQPPKTQAADITALEAFTKTPGVIKSNILQHLNPLEIADRKAIEAMSVGTLGPAFREAAEANRLYNINDGFSVVSVAARLNSLAVSPIPIDFNQLEPGRFYGSVDKITGEASNLGVHTNTIDSRKQTAARMEALRTTVAQAPPTPQEALPSLAALELGRMLSSNNTSWSITKHFQQGETSSSRSITKGYRDMGGNGRFDEFFEVTGTSAYLDENGNHVISMEITGAEFDCAMDHIETLLNAISESRAYAPRTYAPPFFPNTFHTPLSTPSVSHTRAPQPIGLQGPESLEQALARLSTTGNDNDSYASNNSFSSSSFD